MRSQRSAEFGLQSLVANSSPISTPVSMCRQGLFHASVKFESRGNNISLKSAGGIRDDIVPSPSPQSESGLLSQANGIEECVASYFVRQHFRAEKPGCR